MNTRMINTVEALLFGAGRPLRLSEIRSLLDSDGINAELSEIKQVINMLEERHDASSLEVVEVASGFRLHRKEASSHSLPHLGDERAPRISEA